MKERPILFSAPMVRALIAGTKTQTRRVLKLRPGFDFEERDDGRLWPWAEHPDHDADVWMPCPYGQPGDRLWVREAFALEHPVEPDQPLPHSDGRPVLRRPDADIDCVHPLWKQPHYRATDPVPELMYEQGPVGGREDEIGVRWKPSIHMPRWASRILLEITDVRVELLQGISEADAIAEGIERPEDMTAEAIAALDIWEGAERRCFNALNQPIHQYRRLWDQINGEGAWAANPWVWAVSFKRVEGQQP